MYNFNIAIVTLTLKGCLIMSLARLALLFPTHRVDTVLEATELRDPLISQLYLFIV